PCVPSHRYPSGLCPIARTQAPGSPSRERQVSTVQPESRFEASSARTGDEVARSAAARAARRSIAESRPPSYSPRRARIEERSAAFCLPIGRPPAARRLFGTLVRDPVAESLPDHDHRVALHAPAVLRFQVEAGEEHLVVLPGVALLDVGVANVVDVRRVLDAGGGVGTG